MKEQGLKGRRRVKGEFIYIHIGLCYLDADREEDVKDVVVN